MDHIPERGELILYTLQMDVNKIRNKLSSIYALGVADPKTVWLESMLIKAQKKVKDRLDLENRKVEVHEDFPWYD